MSQDNTIRCHSCGALLDASKVTCPHCGASLEKPKKQPYTLGVIILGLAILTAYAPSKSEFVEHISVSFHEKINNSELSNNELASGLAKGMVNVLLDYAVNESNFYAFKIFTLDMHLARAFNKNIEDIKFLGIAGSFIPLNKNKYENFLGNRITKRESTEESNAAEYKNNIPDIDSTISGTYDLHHKAAIFIDEVFNAMSANNDVAIRVVEKYWAPVVILDGHRVNKNNLASQKIEFFQKWPLRNYVSNPTLQEIECDRVTQICKVEGLVNWGLENYKGNKKLKGSSEYEYSIDFSRDLPMITEETNRVIQR